MQFFRTLNPSIAIQCRDGSRILWEAAEGDPAGYHATEEHIEISALENCIRRKIGGAITEISETEYEAVKKKGLRYGQFRIEREGISAPEAPDTVSRPASPPPSPPRREVVVETEPVSAKPDEDDAGPKVGRRKS